MFVITVNTGRFKFIICDFAPARVIFIVAFAMYLYIFFYIYTAYNIIVAFVTLSPLFTHMKNHFDRKFDESIGFGLRFTLSLDEFMIRLVSKSLWLRRRRDTSWVYLKLNTQ